MGKIKRIGVFTSGGDSPGMNAAIRAVVRTGIYHNLEVIGIRHGYQGLINGFFKQLKSHSVSEIIQRGGTILKTARSEEFKTAEGRKKAYENLKKEDIDGVVAIGGDGTFRGARIFNEEYDIPFIGVPGTIDNDIYGTDATIGYDTALNTAIEAIDKIRDTASAHNRLFFIEVMGAEAGFIAIRSGISCGAEAILIPELKDQAKSLKKQLEEGKRRKKSSNIIIVAEGDDEGGAAEIANKVRDDFKEYSVRVTVLGHIQRGGSPTAFDRVTASRLGNAAVEALLDDQKSLMVGLKNNAIVQVPLRKAVKTNKDVNWELMELAKILSV